jgi:hypothetical protein
LAPHRGAFVGYWLGQYHLSISQAHILGCVSLSFLRSWLAQRAVGQTRATKDADMSRMNPRLRELILLALMAGAGCSMAWAGGYTWTGGLFAVLGAVALVGAFQRA